MSKPIIPSQRRQSARFFLQSSELGHSHPLTYKRVCSPPPHPQVLGGGTHSLGGEGVGVPNSDEDPSVHTRLSGGKKCCEKIRETKR
jgi:hypothetical protein